MAVTAGAVSSRQDLAAFLRLPNRLHRDSPHYVWPLTSERRRFLSPPTNPFFSHADVALFLARADGGEVVGRISAHVDWNYVRFQGVRAGFFGFFDSVDDPQVAAVLVRAAEAHLRRHGMESVVGPLHFTTNDEAGVLVKGFSAPPSLMMPYNHPYYGGLLEACGYAKEKDLYAYWVENTGRAPAFLRRAAEKARRSGRVTLRRLDLSRFDRELDAVKRIYNSAWERNWGFVPMTDAEIEHLARNLRPIIDPSLVFLAFVDADPAGVFIALPDYNQALRGVKGRLFPFGFLRFLAQRRRIDRLRVMVLGVRQEYRGLGIEALFLEEIFRRGIERGYAGAELSWVLEDNVAMNRIIGRLASKPYRVYRVYGKTL